MLIASIGLLLIIAAAISGRIKNYFEGEEFIIYHFANKLPHDQAWQSFFYKFGRPIEAIYWTYQYELVGFNPLVTHSLSFVLLLIVSILASVCLLNVWPEGKRSKLLPYFFVFSIFINWISTSTVLRQSYDNGRISLIFFFLAGLALQRWARKQRARWLVVSTGFFLISVLSYENAAFLFPALVLLALPLIPMQKIESIRKRFYFFVALSAAGGLILLITPWFYRTIARPVATPVLDFDIGDTFIRIIESGPLIYLKFGQISIFSATPLNLLIAISLLSTLVLTSLGIIRIYRESESPRTDETRSRWFSIYLASLWFMIFGPLPYILLGYDVGGRVYSSAVFGVFPLILMLYEFAWRHVVRLIAIILLVTLAISGLLMVKEEYFFFRELEVPLNIFYRGLKDVVPHVRPHTGFIIINGPVPSHGCGPSLEMLYNQVDLECLAIHSNFDQNSIRSETEFETQGQDMQGPNWIVILVTNNVPAIVGELNPDDFDLLIKWENTAPIKTNNGRILFDEIPPPSDFYLHLLERAKVLFPD